MHLFPSDWLRAARNIVSPSGNLENAAYLAHEGAVGGPPPPSITQHIRPTFALVANKIDLEHLRVIKSERHHKFAQVDGHIFS